MGREEEGWKIFIDNTHFEICAFKIWYEYLKRGRRNIFFLLIIYILKFVLSKTGASI